mmetsp:Transcript_17536/g.61646  ORF Transcript_17536/g.61646 Transcript_17536/m.61646 type:complete len:237 (+) Transcript_17536:479-1189(+)
MGDATPVAHSSCRRTSASSALSCATMVSVVSSFTTAELTMVLARSRYCSVDSDCSKLTAAGDTVAIIIVLLLPPRLSLSRRVSTELRYGTNDARRPCASGVDSALITAPSALRLRLMVLASLSRSPLTPAVLARSLPARSTRLILLIFSHTAPVARLVPRCRKRSVKSACERLDSSFICVAAVVRSLLPMKSSCSTSSKHSTGTSSRSSTYAPSVTCSRTRSVPAVGLKRSRTRSL